MTFFEKDINSLKEADLQWLVDIQYSEASIVEYKSILDFGSNEEIEKVLSQVVSFANAKGGNLIYGIQADKGVPQKLEGQPIPDADGLIQRIENVIRQNIRPQLSLYETRAIKLNNGNYIIVFRIEQSWNRPHQFRFNNKFLFYTRSSNGRTQIDVEDLRNLFTGAAELRHRIEDFRTERISELVSGNTPIESVQPPMLVLHSVPISTFANNELLNPNDFKDYGQYLEYFGHPGRTYLNFDGLLNTNKDSISTKGYTQVYRDCRLEMVRGDWQRVIQNSEEKIIPQSATARVMLNAVVNLLAFYKALNIIPPILLMFSLIGVKDNKFIDPGSFYNIETTAIDKDVLQFPSIYVESFDVKPHELLRDTFDILWQTANFSKCNNYDEEGNWRYNILV